jgi:uncharacterized protein YhaN
MVHTQSEAKRFFAEKAIQQARAEGVPMSDAERRMLFWSESDPEVHADPQLVEQLAAEISDPEYEMKIAGLLKRALSAESAVDTARDRWKQARSVLNQGDHYIGVMIKRGVGEKLKRWWEFWM